MIDSKKLSIYKKYRGDIDAWARIATDEESQSLTDEDWYLIDSLIQDVQLSREDLNLILEKNLCNNDVKEELFRLAKSIF